MAFKEKSKELLFFWFSVSCRSHVNWNLLKNKDTECAPELHFYHISPKKNLMTIKPFKIAAKIIFISRKINLNIQNLKIIPYNQKQNANSTWCVICEVQYV